MESPARHTALERAFDLAAKGEFLSIAEIKQQLQREGFTTEQITGPTLLRQIRSICMSAQKRKA